MSISVVAKKLVIPSDLSTKDNKEYDQVDKMCSGLPYKIDQKELIEGRAFAKTKCFELNKMNPVDPERNTILKELLGTFSDNCCIESPFYCDYGANIHLEENVFMNFNCTILDITEVRIGRGTLLAPGVQIYGATHPVDPIERRSTEYGKPIIIGRDCWIGGMAIICPGVVIGDGVTVGAGSVVTKNVEPWTVVAGNPAKIIRRLNKPEDY